MRRAGLVVVVILAGCGGRTVLGGPPDRGAPTDGSVPERDRGTPTPDDFGWRPDRAWPLDAPHPWPQDLPHPWPTDHSTPWPTDFGWPTDVGGCSSTIGTPCTSPYQCCGGLSCTTLSTGVKLCTKTCTPDDPATPLVNEDSCPGQHRCVDADGFGNHACLKRCKPSQTTATCPAGLACHPRSTGLTRLVDQAVCAFPACTKAQDCPVRLAEACSLASSAPQCLTTPGSFCALDAPDTTSAHCAVGGSCNVKTGLCQPHAMGKPGAKVGDPCRSDGDCAGTMRCDQQRGVVGDVHARNGYCTIEGCSFASSLPSAACPAGSTCNKLHWGGRCFKTCDLSQAAQCRGLALDMNGDYECYAWNNLAVGGTPVAAQPTCEPTDYTPCNVFAGSPIDCTALGLQQNPTKMQCRERATGKLLSPYDPSGYCLDTTSSGP